MLLATSTQFSALETIAGTGIDAIQRKNAVFKVQADRVDGISTPLHYAGLFPPVNAPNLKEFKSLPLEDTPSTPR